MIRWLTPIGNGPSTPRPWLRSRDPTFMRPAITHPAGTSSLQRLMAALLVISAVLFVIGIALERAGPGDEDHSEAPPRATQVTGTAVESGNESQEAQPQATSGAPNPETQGETTF